jgi:myo-inositol-1(or 4)-monophosphatase
MTHAETDHPRWLSIAIEAARAAGEIIRGGLHDELDVRYKGDINLVTQIDVASERAIVDHLRAQCPDHGILAEEGSGHDGSSGYRWLIDPLDGTTNYAHRFPFYCVSIGLEYKEDVVLGVVYDPIRDELFTAARDAGARCNGRPLAVSSTPALETSLLVTGFAYDGRRSTRNNFRHFIDMSRVVQGVRRTGSAALDLCYVAAGRFEAFWEQHLKPWDVCAGALIVEEAGGRITGTDGSPFATAAAHLVASNGKIHDEVLTVIRECRAARAHARTDA